MLIGADEPLLRAFSDLQPSARLQMTWIERSERNFDRSGFELIAQGGIFPKFSNELGGGFQLSTGDTSSTASPNAVDLASGFSNKPIGIHQAYLESHLGSTLRWSGLLGKFKAPNLFSPLTWDEEIAPEGLFQSLEFLPTLEDRISLYAAQYSVDQVATSITTGTPLRRSWLFQQGLYGRVLWTSETELKLALNHYHFFDPSERLANKAGALGNTYLGAIDNNPRFRYAYSPLELMFSASAHPLGILTGISAAFVINFRTPDKQRSFFAEAHLGNSWKPQNFYFSVAYYYQEPDVTLSLFTNHLYGYTNRKAARGEISYFFLKNLRAETSVLYGEILQASSSQTRRKELRASMELLF